MGGWEEGGYGNNNPLAWELGKPISYKWAIHSSNNTSKVDHTALEKRDLLRHSTTFMSIVMLIKRSALLSVSDCIMASNVLQSLKLQPPPPPLPLQLTTKQILAFFSSISLNTNSCLGGTLFYQERFADIQFVDKKVKKGMVVHPVRLR